MIEHCECLLVKSPMCVIRCFNNILCLIKLRLISIFILVFLSFVSSANAKYASFVINENTKRIYHKTNADTQNYPASLTKIMTLYMIFDALKFKKNIYEY